MALKKNKPVTASRRFMELSDYSEVTKGRPERNLTESKRNGAGRGAGGRIAVRHRGGGHKRRYRKVDFKREKDGVPARVAAIEYDPNRSARIALLYYADGEKRYILAPARLKVGQSVVSGERAEPAVGNSLPMAAIPIGLPIHNLELRPGVGAKLVRSAGQQAWLLSREKGRVQVKLPSGEIRVFKPECRATIGRVGNAEHETIASGKAGRSRWKGIRPTVRGVAMNPVDHPMGGGEGRTSGGGDPVSPWGKIAKGQRTRRGKRPSDKVILKRRK